MSIFQNSFKDAENMLRLYVLQVFLLEQVFWFDPDLYRVAYWVSKAMITVLIMMIEQMTLSNNGWLTIRNIFEASNFCSKPQSTLKD